MAADRLSKKPVTSSPRYTRAPFRDLYRRLYWWREDRCALRPLAGIRTVVAFGASLGDNLLCSNVLAGLHAAGAGPLAMLTPHADLFAELPFPVRCLPFDLGMINALSRRTRPRLVLPTYGRYDASLDRHVPPPRAHLIAEMCRSVGLTGTVALKPVLHLAAAERARGEELARGKILLQVSGLGAALPARNKEWPLERWQRVADALGQGHSVAQIGARTDPRLQNVIDWRGRFRLREVAGCLSAARLFVGGEGFLMHLARAVDCRAVIVLGGRTAAHQTCYPENANLATALPCSPCWQMNTCSHGRECLSRITPEDVCAAVEAQLALPPLRNVHPSIADLA